jgi:hypothetical protein
MFGTKRLSSFALSFMLPSQEELYEKLLNRMKEFDNHADAKLEENATMDD